jgi:hypothetical protein
LEAYRMKKEIPRPNHLVGLAYFNISAVPENHPNRKAVLKAFNQEVDNV